MFDLVIHAPRAIIEGVERAAVIAVEDGAIAGILEPGQTPEARESVTLAADEVLLPGLVDTHVHVNEPGRTEWEGFASATRAAALGGVTTLIDMPLNSIPSTVTVEALETKRAAAAGQTFIDVGFWGGAVPGNVADLRPLHEAGVYGFKCFLLHSGVDEFRHLSPEEMREAQREIGSFGSVLIVHAEDPEVIDASVNAGGPEYGEFLASRPKGAENRAIETVVAGVRETGCRTHILHLSSAEALPIIADARGAGLPLSVETCPHYLSITAEQIQSGATQFKCCPPIREASNQDALWAGLADGLIDIVVTDHSPCTADLKRFDLGDFGLAWGGIAGLQVGLSATWSAARERGVPLTSVVQWMATRPAELMGVAGKGEIAVGNRADFAVFAPEESFVVKIENLRHKNPVSAYAERELHGVVRETWLGGARLNVDAAARGALLRRGEDQ
ncbi:allantoinase AllB [Micrococcales bacterium 31B]|nr:allantoinase AllB [Micrococcales bacterium 31B]